GPNKFKPALLIPRVAVMPFPGAAKVLNAHSPDTSVTPLQSKAGAAPLGSQVALWIELPKGRVASTGARITEGVMSKNTAVNRNGLAVTSTKEVLVRVTTRFVPLWVKVAEASRAPELKVTGPGLTMVALATDPNATSITNTETQRLIGNPP